MKDIKDPNETLVSLWNWLKDKRCMYIIELYWIITRKVIKKFVKKLDLMHLALILSTNYEVSQVNRINFIIGSIKNIVNDSINLSIIKIFNPISNFNFYFCR